MVVSTEEEGDSFFTGFLEGLITDIGKIGTGLLGGLAAQETGATVAQTSQIVSATPVTTATKATNVGLFPAGSGSILLLIGGAALLIFALK